MEELSVGHPDVSGGEIWLFLNWGIDFLNYIYEVHDGALHWRRIFMVLEVLLTKMIFGFRDLGMSHTLPFSTKIWKRKWNVTEKMKNIFIARSMECCMFQCNRYFPGETAFEDAFGWCIWIKYIKRAFFKLEILVFWCNRNMNQTLRSVKRVLKRKIGPYNFHPCTTINVYEN